MNDLEIKEPPVLGLLGISLNLMKNVNSREDT
jgi:hypothetical protein